ncbi:MAG: hypothetical protein JW983_01650 [Elusimicrobia bacterium]|nr:hypothetical protein [Elusimicrobiota bacterium]
MGDSNEVISYCYRFTFKNGEEKEFNIKLDKKTLGIISDKPESYPDWTELRCFKCPNCPLDENQNKYCPIAVNLIEFVNSFKSRVSYEEVDIVIKTEARQYMKHVALQVGLSSLLGIYMVTSSCPIMEKLKPMVCSHLPFATLEEGRYRAISMYLLAQYFLYKRGETPDWELKNLVKLYEEVRIVNRNFCKRISSTITQDASVNALVALNTNADFVPISIAKNKLALIEDYFNAYFKEK